MSLSHSSSVRPKPGVGYTGTKIIKRTESERRPNRNQFEGLNGQPSKYQGSRLPAPVEVQTIGNYRIIKTIGKGNFAKVKLAKHIPTGRQVAIKVIDKMTLSTSGREKLFREVRIMKILDHPNIVKLFQVMETERYMYLVMEYASGGELFDLLLTNGRLKEKDARLKFRQIISAVNYCHKKHVVHRDLKAENLLLDQDQNIKIADFGFSNEFNPAGKLDTFCGSPPYAAPELFQGKKYIGPEVDVWSLGVVLFTITSGSLPFDGVNLKDLREKVVKGKYRIPFYISTDCEHLLKKFLVTSPAKRITLEAAMKEKWINIGYEGTSLMTYTEPSDNLLEDRIIEMEKMGFSRSQINKSYDMQLFDDVMATYRLLGQRASAADKALYFSSSAISLSGDASLIPGRMNSTTNRAPSHPAVVQTSAPRNPPPRKPVPNTLNASSSTNFDNKQCNPSAETPPRRREAQSFLRKYKEQNVSNDARGVAYKDREDATSIANKNNLQQSAYRFESPINPSGKDTQGDAYRRENAPLSPTSFQDAAYRQDAQNRSYTPITASNADSNMQNTRYMLQKNDADNAFKPDFVYAMQNTKAQDLDGQLMTYGTGLKQDGQYPAQSPTYQYANYRQDAQSGPYKQDTQTYKDTAYRLDGGAYRSHKEVLPTIIDETISNGFMMPASASKVHQHNEASDQRDKILQEMQLQRIGSFLSPERPLIIFKPRILAESGDGKMGGSRRPIKNQTTSSFDQLNTTSTNSKFGSYEGLISCKNSNANLTGQPELQGVTSTTTPWKTPVAPYHPASSQASSRQSSFANRNTPLRRTVHGTTVQDRAKELAAKNRIDPVSSANQKKESNIAEPIKIERHGRFSFLNKLTSKFSKK